MARAKAHRPRVQVISENIFALEFGLAYSDGYRVEVAWSDEDGAWLARLRGTKGEKRPTGVGSTKELALCDLACSLACLSDTLYGLLHPSRPSDA